MRAGLGIFFPLFTRGARFMLGESRSAVSVDAVLEGLLLNLALNVAPRIAAG